MSITGRLKVVVVAGLSIMLLLQTVTGKAQSIIARVKCSSETIALSSLFPARKRVEGPSFNPIVECVVLPQQEKKIGNQVKSETINCYSRSSERLQLYRTEREEETSPCSERQSKASEMNVPNEANGGERSHSQSF